MDPLARTSSSSSGGVVASLESLTKDQLVVALKKAHLHVSRRLQTFFSLSLGAAAYK